MADTIDINVFETTETVTINATPNLTTININSVTSSGAVTSVNGLVGDVVIATPTLQQVTTAGGSTTTGININRADNAPALNVNNTNGLGIFASSDNGVVGRFNLDSGGNTSNIVEFQKNGSNQAYITHDGNIVSNKLQVTGGTSDQILLANGTTSSLSAKENTITAGTSSQYFRGDKTFQTLDKNAVGLTNVDNTSDANKPVSTAQQTALDLKQNSLGYTPFRFINNTQSSGSALTGETQMIRITIPANSFASTDKFKFRFAISKIGTANVSNIRVKLSTSASMPSGASNLIAIFNPTNTTIYAPVERAMAIIGGNLKGFSFSTSNTTDSGSSTTASFQQVAFDVTQTQYLYIAINVNPTTDVSYLEMVELTN